MEFEEVNFADAGVGIGAPRIGDTSDDEPDDSVNDALLIYLMITRMRRRREKDRSIWVDQINQERTTGPDGYLLLGRGYGQIMIPCMQGIITWLCWASRIFVVGPGIGAANDPLHGRDH